MKWTLLLPLLVLSLFSSSMAHDWVLTNPDAEWNKFPEQERVVFKGTLEDVGESQEFSFVMRHNPYRLRGEEGVLDVYGRSPVLTEFVGRMVEIEGKRVRTEVEGRLFDEIWPVRIRLSGPD